MLLRSGVTILLAMSLGGCATVTEVNKRNMEWYKDNTSVIPNKDVDQFLGDQNALIKTISTDENIPIPPPSNNWRPFVDAGTSYVDDRCTKYMEALFYFNRVRGIASREITSAGVVTAAILQATKAANALATIAAAGFNFANGTVDNLGTGLLYGIDPGTIRNLVTGEQTKFKKTIPAVVSDRYAAMDWVRKYAEVCLPINISQVVNDKLAESTKTSSKVTDQTKDSGKPAAAAAAKKVAANKKPQKRAPKSKPPKMS